MRVRSPIQCGYGRGGTAVLQEGVNDLDVAKLSESERMLVEELIAAKVVELLDDAVATPESGSRLVMPAAEIDDDFDEPPVQPTAPVTAAAARTSRRKSK